MGAATVRETSPRGKRGCLDVEPLGLRHMLLSIGIILLTLLRCAYHHCVQVVGYPSLRPIGADGSIGIGRTGAPHDAVFPSAIGLFRRRYRSRYVVCKSRSP